MTLYEAIYNHWVGSSLMTGIPVYSGNIPAENEPPAGTFSLVSGPAIVSHDGRNKSRNEIWQIAGLHYYLYDAAEIREKILKLMDSFTGDFSGLVVQSCIPERSPRDIRDSTRGYWMAIHEFRIFYTVEE